MIFDYPPTENSQGAIAIDVKSTNGRIECLPPGESTCGYVISGGNTFTFTCGNAVLEYIKN